MNQFKMIAVALILVGFASGCATRSALVQTVDEPAHQVASGQAEIVFMRPSSYAAAVQASVYDVTDGQLEFIGIVSQGTRINFAVTPGERRFMVIAENADFMEAQLDGDKTYYALVAPRMGVWRARFSLLPVRKDPDARYSMLTPDFDRWLERTEWVEMAPAAQSWFQSNRSSIQSKKASYMERWNRMAPHDKEVLTLSPEDGVAR